MCIRIILLFRKKKQQEQQQKQEKNFITFKKVLHVRKWITIAFCAEIKICKLEMMQLQEQITSSTSHI